MDLVTQASLEALLLKATNSANQNIDTGAVEAFIGLINKEKDGAQSGVRIISSRLSSGSEKELLQTLNVLDSCMLKCGSAFQNEVGKFRFLNEMIKLVSPKYLGQQTPLIVKQKVLQLMYVWTLDYPRELKIKEAFDMLRKQGVIRDIPNPNITSNVPNVSEPRKVGSVFYDEEKSKILQKLLQSKDPEDIQAANWLIKSMVKEDDKRTELKSQKLLELESAQNNVRLLNEMLDSYKPNSLELDLIQELHQSCQRLKPNILKMQSERLEKEELLFDVCRTNEELQKVLFKYESIIIKGQFNGQIVKDNSLVDLIQNQSELGHSSTNVNGRSASEIDVLTQLFTSASLDDIPVLKPEPLSTNLHEHKDLKHKMGNFNDLDLLSDELMQQELGQQQKKIIEKTSMNQLQKQKAENTILTKTTESVEDLDYNLLSANSSTFHKIDQIEPNNPNSAIETDDYLVDITESANLNETVPKCAENQPKCANLKDLFINLEDITSSSLKPEIILENRNGITVNLHYTKDKPLVNVSVYVLTTTSRNSVVLTDYLCQAVAPKGCKLKLLPPSSTTLPIYKPFLPQSAISQVLLLFNPENAKIALKFIISFTMDGENVTEMGEIDCLIMD